MDPKPRKLPESCYIHGPDSLRDIARAIYVGPLEHLKGMTALVYDEYPCQYLKLGDDAPAVGPDQ